VSLIDSQAQMMRLDTTSRASFLTGVTNAQAWSEKESGF
jgi:hypothetical protein